MTLPRPPQPDVMALIGQRRRRLGLSLRRAGLLAGISDSRWRQLEDGYRQTKLGPVPESAPARTLARMALAVGVTAGELRQSGCTEAAAELDVLAEREAAASDGAARDAARAADAVDGLSGRQRDALAEEIAGALRRIRDGSLPMQTFSYGKANLLLLTERERSRNADSVGAQSPVTRRHADNGDQ